MNNRTANRLFMVCAAILAVLITAMPLFAQNSLLKDFTWRTIGPSNMSGRISDIEAFNDDFTHVIISTASGGVYKSVNAGTTWEPIFDDYGTASIGDVAIFQKDPDIIWVGTGESKVRNSVAWGDGVYKSEDGGATFTNMGLKDTHHIARVIIHPDNKNTVYVASQGHLWGYTGERGLFMTDNGGKSWKKLTQGLPDDGKTGCTDLVRDPTNPKVMYAAFWERKRYPNKFDGGGPNGGIFKTEDGGKSWTKLTKGLPEGDIGRIGLAIYRKDPKIVMALLEHSVQLQPGDKDYDNMKVLGTGIYRSENGGKSWKYMNRYNNRPFYYSQIRINPIDDKRIYILTGGFLMSYDGGKTLERQTETKIHGDHHALWADPTNVDRFYYGTDGGAAITHDHGKSYTFYHNILAAQFYAVGVDMRNPYWVFGGLQDNGTWGGPSRVRDPNGILKDHWIKISGGDGFHSQIDPTDWTTVYSESQGGNIGRRNIVTGQSVNIKPNKRNITNYDDYISPSVEDAMREAGYRGSFRWNWSAPIIISPHNPSIIYFAANHLFKSVDKGDNWTIISPDLTKNDPVLTERETGGITSDITGAETHCTIITVSESALNSKIIWVGTDDGNVQLTTDSGVNWKNVRNAIPEVPKELWVSRVEASHFDEGTAYVSFDGHRSDNFAPWIFKTTDFGISWTKITNGIPDGNPIYVVKEDLKNKNLLFSGSEFACFVSLDGGMTWERFMEEMPTASFHDLVIHPRDGDLVAGTHGRGIWIVDDITPLQQFTDEVAASDVHLFKTRPAYKWLRVMKSDPRMGHLYFEGENLDPVANISFYMKNLPAGDVTLEISDITGKMIYSTIIEPETGINKFAWNMLESPSDGQVALFDRTMKNNIKTIKDRVSKRAEKRRIDQLEKDFDNARTVEAKNAAREAMMDEFGDYATGWRFWGRALSGPAAKAGQYKVDLQVNGKHHHTILTIKDDPLMEKHR